MSRGYGALKASSADRRRPPRYISQAGPHGGIRRCPASDTHTDMKVLVSAGVGADG